MELTKPVYLEPTIGGPLFGNRDRVDAIRMTNRRDALTFQRIMRRSPRFEVLDDISIEEARRIVERGGGLRQL